MKYETTEGMKVFEPISIKGMTLKNRIAIGPYGSHPSDDDGTPNAKTVSYYDRLARTDAGFIMVGIVNPVPADSDLQYQSDIPESPLL